MLLSEKLLRQKHVMVDLETWGVGVEAVPISIGAVKFDITGREPISAQSDGFHVGILPASAMAYGMKADADTLMWWLDDKQSEARSHWMRLEKTDIASALTAFIMWLNGSDYCVWGNGAPFDNVILRNAYMKTLGPGTLPWEHWNDRCYRTLKNMVDVALPDMEPYGIVHSALSDAMRQAAHLQLIVKAMTQDAMAGAVPAP